MQLTYASESKILTMFERLYRHMSPLSRHPIVELYQQIRQLVDMHETVELLQHIIHIFRIQHSHINGHHQFDFESVVTKCFSTLFPVVYHQAVHSTAGDFNADYKMCLQHTYDELQPFGGIPKQLATSLQHSLRTATLFVTALERAADILASTEDLTAEALSPKCRQHLLMITHCNKCRGSQVKQVKSCYGYCTNVLR